MSLASPRYPVILTAFMNSYLEEMIYYDVPEEFGKPGECLRLLRALYSLRQSPLL